MNPIGGCYIYGHPMQPIGRKRHPHHYRYAAPFRANTTSANAATAAHMRKKPPRLCTRIKTKSRLHRCKRLIFNVGETGFEPATLCSQSRYANRTALHPEFPVEKPIASSPAFCMNRGHRPPQRRIGKRIKKQTTQRAVCRICRGDWIRTSDLQLPEAGALTGLRYTPNKDPYHLKSAQR